MPGAFDEVRPPDLNLVEDCVHCGFCLEACPTYELWREEMDSPRGRIVLIKGALEGGAELSPEFVTHIDRCLGCMACVTACPSGVEYDKLIEATRAQVERATKRPVGERLLRRLVFATFTHPARLRVMALPLAAARRLGILRVLRRSRTLARFPRLKALVALAPTTSLRASLTGLPSRTEAVGQRRGEVAVLQGCVQRVFFADVNAATVEALAAEGFDVVAPKRPRCCGALQIHTGCDDAGRRLAKTVIETYEQYAHICVNAAGCGSAMKDYPHLFRDDPDWSDRAARFATKVRDVNEYLADYEPVAPRHPLAIKVAYHDACHLVHAQGIHNEPRSVLRSIPELELVQPEEGQLCCGSAGIYNLLQPGPAAELGRRKVKRLLATGADVVAAANPGCALQVTSHSEALGERITVYHPIELVAASIRGTPAEDLTTKKAGKS